MSTTSASVVQTARSTSSPTRDPLGAYLVTIGVVTIVAFLLIRGAGSLIRTVSSAWPAIVFWMVLLLFVHLIPVRARGLRLVMDLPILGAIALLYSPTMSATVAIIGAADSRELRREISLSRAIFNRAQTGLSTLLASWTFHSLASGLEPWPRAIIATAVALAVGYCVNVSLVLLYLTSVSGTREPLGHFSIGRPIHFLATYLGNGILALVIAQLFVRVGAWSVLIFIVPILVARQALVRGQRLQELAAALQNRERLMELLVDRSVDERTDERLRIAGDLHDDVLQSLIRLWYLTRVLQEQVVRTGGNTSDIQELLEGSEASIESLRAVIHDLKESPLGRGGLLSTLKLLVRDLQLDWKTSIRLVMPKRIDVGAQSQVIAYQIVREGMINALKHAKAQEIRVTVAQEGQFLHLTVEDDGVGFDREAVDQSSHFGMGLMQDRVRRGQGELTVESQEGKGTRLVTVLPVEPGSNTD
jgi:signal transduction histidine kinase